jgi:hypothetical protein
VLYADYAAIVGNGIGHTAVTTSSTRQLTPTQITRHQDRRAGIARCSEAD